VCMCVCVHERRKERFIKKNVLSVLAEFITLFCDNIHGDRKDAYLSAN
jgi:hypothetical protein